IADGLSGRPNAPVEAAPELPRYGNPVSRTNSLDGRWSSSTRAELGRFDGCRSSGATGRFSSARPRLPDQRSPMNRQVKTSVTLPRSSHQPEPKRVIVCCTTFAYDWGGEAMTGPAASKKAERDQLRDQLRGYGCSTAQIAQEMMRRF